MSIDSLMNQDIKTRCNEAYEKVVAYQDKLNATITAIDPKDIDYDKLEGKLKGIPVALKDNVSTKGIKTTAASRILDNYYPVYDATIVEKLRKEGAVFVAKASMDELAMGGSNLTSMIGPCHNPYDLNRISGGSSGGSAVLVASGAVSVAIGSDTGDSVRKPAGYCGVVGVKPTYGRISRYGIIPYASSLDHVGYFTRNIKDASLVLEVLAGRDDHDMTSSFEKVDEYSKLLNSNVEGKKILVFDNVVENIREDIIINSFNNVIKGLEEKGAVIKHVRFDDKLMKALFPTYFVIANAEATANHSNLDGIRFGHRVDGNTMEEIMINTRTRGFSSFIKQRFVVGSYSLFEENQERLLKKAQRVRRLIVDEVMKELKDADCLIAPASGNVAPLIKGNKSDELAPEYLIAENHLVIGNFGGLPSLTQPMGFKDNLPFGVNITCNPFKEADMFNIALAIEEITGLKDLVKEDF
ncbi:MAG: amidase family protein [Erysipelotrichaceae bacterium]|nr:amidase family protein [Erysipelotrichaceae bacterium]